MLIEKKISFIVPEDIKFNLDDIVEALKNGITGRSYSQNDGLWTFLDVDGFADSEGNVGVLILKLGDDSDRTI